MKYLFCFLFGFFFFLWTGIPALSQTEAIQQSHPEYVPGTILFKIRPEYRSFCETHRIEIEDLSSRFDGLGSWQLRSNFTHVPNPVSKANPGPDLTLVYELTYEGNWNMSQALQHIRSHPAIAYAEPRYIYHTFYQPNDPYSDTTFGIEWQWYLTPIRAREAWDLQRGDTSIVIGITDSGISYKHPDLKANLLINRDDPPDGIDNDQDGYVDNYRGWDFGGESFRGVGDNDASFVYDHGVSVTGIAAATTDNNLGTASISFNCRYLPLKSGPDEIPGAITHGYESILYAAQQGAQIINCSWGGQVRSQVGADVIDYVIQNYGVAVIAACGNTPDDLRFFPAAYPGVISVTNVHQQDSICCPQYASPPGEALGTTYNYSVDVSAPGWKIYTPTNDGIYHFFTGTSAASPVVAAAVALTLAHFPAYTGFQAAQRVRVTTDDVYHLPYNQPYRDKMGTGRINVYRALTDPLKPSIRHGEIAVKNTRGGIIFSPGDTLVIQGNFTNYLDPSTSGLRLQAELPDTVAATYLEILEGEYLPGMVSTLATFSNSTAPFLIRIKPNAPEDLEVALRLSYRDSALQYQDFEYLEFRVNPTLLDITENNFYTSIGSRGNWGYNDYPENEVGLGVKFKGDQRSTLFEGGFLLGNSPSLLLDNLHNEQGGSERDFSPRNVLQPHAAVTSDYLAKGSFDDRNAPRQLGVKIDQRIYAWHEPEDEDYLILEYVIRNESGGPLSGLYAGLMADWNLVIPTTDACSLDPLSRMVFAYDVEGLNPNFFGMSLLTPGPLRAAAFSVPDFSFSDSAKFRAISNLPTGGSASAGLSGNGTDIVHFLATGPFNLAAADSYKVAFALMGGSNFTYLQNTTRTAREKYRCYLEEQGPAAGFSISANPAGRNQPVQFADLNTSASSWHWDFGDGQSSTLQNPAHSYQLPGNYTVRFTASDGDCEVLSKKNLEVRNLVTALEPRHTSGLTLFPNPTSGKVRVTRERLSAAPGTWKLINALGQTLFSGRDPGLLSWEIDLSGQPAGLYWLQIAQDGNSFSFKIVRE